MRMRVKEDPDLVSSVSIRSLCIAVGFSKVSANIGTLFTEHTTHIINRIVKYILNWTQLVASLYNYDSKQDISC